MGLFDLFTKKNKTAVGTTRSALEEAKDPKATKGAGGAVTRLIQSLLAVGVDGRPPFASATSVADRALEKTGSADAAIKLLTRSHVRGGATGGFITGLGGFATMPVAIPANVFEFYVQATRMVAAIARLRGYDLADPTIRTAVLLTLVGSDADDVLRKAGVGVGGGMATGLALRRLPASAMMVINKAIGFRLLRTVGEKTLTRFGKAIPFIGGAVGGGMDGWMMSRIAKAAKKEFPAIEA